MDPSAVQIDGAACSFCPGTSPPVPACAGDMLLVQERGESIELRPVRGGTKLEEVNGVLTVAGDISLPPKVDLVAESREERLDAMLSYPA